MRPYTLTPDLDGEGLHIGIVCSRFNESVTYKELDACLKQLSELGVDERNIMVVTVPGALEIGLVLQEMAETYEFDALIALGSVIRGETYHFEIVSNESASAITKVTLKTSIPVANGILTAETDEQAETRAEQKGEDCALCAVEMANLLLDLEPEEDEDSEDDLDDEYDSDGDCVGVKDLDDEDDLDEDYAEDDDTDRDGIDDDLDEQDSSSQHH